MTACYSHNPELLFVRPHTRHQDAWVNYSLAKYDRYVICSSCQLIGCWVEGGKLSWFPAGSDEARVIQEVAGLWNTLMQGL